MTENKELTPFDIHLSCIRPLVKSTYEDERQVTFESFREMANQHYSNIYGTENDDFLQKLYNWFVVKGIFVRLGNKYGERIYIFKLLQYRKVGIGSLFIYQFEQYIKATDLETAKVWRLNVLKNSLADVEYDELEAEEGEVIDSWEPLPIDRESQPYKDTIEATESAIEVIEESNGYAANEPEERNAILTSLKGGFDALKNGFPTRKYIKTTLISGLGFIAKKFTNAAMGVAAKKPLSY